MFASILLQAQFVLQKWSLRQRLDVIANGIRHESLIFSFLAIVGVISQQHDFDLLPCTLLVTFVQVIVVPSGSLSNRAVIAVVG